MRNRPSIRQKHANVILKLNCYANIFVEGEKNPAPKRLVRAIKNRYVFRGTLEEKAAVKVDRQGIYY